MVYFIAENHVEVSGQFEYNGKIFPNGWLQSASEETLTSEGLLALTQVWPELEPGNEYTGAYVDNFVALTRTYEQALAPLALSGSHIGNATIPIPAGWVISIAIKENDEDPESHPEETVNIGTTEEGADIIDQYPITHEYVNIAVNRFFPENSYIYITTTADYSYSISTQSI